ncbi:unnamed protein product [Adineta steineri]|uniref:ATP-grasp domain-containing protein n=1 Tax=Adineta steineri TaxID=433720 RepID=A0A815UVU1_9BILA|nr:unnamed protein product [Adineta steineri]CAF4190446.1 unnamed protein product [Adineta steineri]
METSSTITNLHVALVYNLKRNPHQEEEAEFDSQTTIDAILSTIIELGYKNVFPIEADKNLVENLLKYQIDVVFNIAEGLEKRSRESQVPAICDLLDIEHTGSDTTALAITHDKILAKRLLIQDNILTPKYIVYNGKSLPRETISSLRFPVIIKPSHEGSSKGIDNLSVVDTIEEFETVVVTKWKAFQQPILCEEYIVGQEYTIAVLGDENSDLNDLQIIGPMEVSWKTTDKYPIYTYQYKLSLTYFSSTCPVKFDNEEQMANVCMFAKRVFVSLGCRDVCRIDFRIDNEGSIYFLELNGIPGIAPNFSDLPVMANKCGISYKTVIERILTPSVNRYIKKKLTKTQ